MKDYCWKNISTLILLMFLCSLAKAQRGNPLQFIREVSQTSRVNPAFQNNTDKLVVGLPLISGSRVNVESNFSFDDFLNSDLLFDFQLLYNSLKEPGKAFTEAEIPIIYLSQKKGKHTFSISISERIIGLGNFDEEFVNFFAQGTEPYYGKNENLGSISAKTQYYREIDFGVARQLTKSFNVGIRPKLIFGKLYYAAESINLSVETLSESETLVLIPQGNFTVGGPIQKDVHPDYNYVSVKPDITQGDYLFQLKNMGFGIDLGFTYQANKQTEIALSVNGIGFSSWQHKTFDITFDETISYPKNKLYQSHTPDADNYQGAQYSARVLNDTIPNITQANALTKHRIDALPIDVNAQIKYTLNTIWELGVSNYFMHYKGYSANYLSGFARAKIGEKLAAASTLNLFNLENVLLGFGMVYSGQKVQYYLSSNNILELVHPSSAKNLNLCFGVNLLFPTN